MAVLKRVPAFAAVVVLTVMAGAALADGPKGFRADWRRAEAAVNDAIDAARDGDKAAVQSQSDSANAALLDLASYASALPERQRAAYAKALDDARVAAQRAMQPGAATSKDDSVRATQDTLQKLTAARSSVPDDWLRPHPCSAMRKQRHQC